MWHSQPAELPPEGCWPVKACTVVCKGIPGRCMAAAALWILAGQGGSEVRALTNTLPFEGSRCIIHSASCVPAA